MDMSNKKNGATKNLFKSNDACCPAAALNQYKNELQNELCSICWIFGKKIQLTMSLEDFMESLIIQIRYFADAPKGSVLNSRILWTFSAAYNLTGNMDYLNTAERAFNYIADHFIDKEYGGVYWTVDYKGNPYDTKKQIYALSFAIYGFSEFYTMQQK